ncbi:hypothetical protein [Roseomonas xinghualingensis]|uniref:hypothetical protein n=1 Tax=Roseomonas xinghualingensis TaxID=2986475 RepID=UPI0021F21FF8|nr:hypothetical protein [Roseomonas sp. SXEYE001]MCV4209531.1 hypothetical protein [Roseomonas sp. SXEYE001]
MDSESSLFLLGIAPGAAPGHPSVRAGRVTGLLAGMARPSLPSSALHLPQPLEFSTVEEVRTWLLVREARFVAALRVMTGCREVGLELREDVTRHAAWLRARDRGLAGGACAVPARAARRKLVAHRLEAILVSEARAAILPDPSAGPGQPGRWAVAVPEAVVARLRAALEMEARKLVGTGLTLHLRPVGESNELARAVLQDG